MLSRRAVNTLRQTTGSLKAWMLPPSTVRCCSSNIVPQATEADPRPETNFPFAKNLFLGKFEREMLIFPEVLSNEELEELELLVKPVEKFFKEDLDHAALDEEARIPDDVMQTLKDMGLFGQIIPVEYGGLGLNATKYARLAEFIALNSGIAVTLGAHQTIGLKGILLAGNEHQKAKYLPQFATGEKIAAFALTEPSSGSDAASIQARSRLSEDGKSWILNGSKIWISNGGIADVFTVFAKTEVTNDKGEVKDAVTAFIVERAFGGVSSGKSEDKLGIRCSNTTEVFFDNTPVPAENVLGNVGGGFKIAMNILNSGRFSMGSALAGALRNLMEISCDHAKNRTQFGKKLSEFGLIQAKFARMAVYAYAMESMAYRTAGILDSYQVPDASIEAAMVKVFSSSHAWDLASEAMQVAGGLGYMKQYPYERILRDTRICMIFEGTNEILRLYIALTCLQHAGNEIKDMIRSLKNPIDTISLLIPKRNLSIRTRKRPHRLDDAVHPNLAGNAEKLEARVMHLKDITQAYLSKFKSQIAGEQMALFRLADIAIEIYAQTSVLGRASRSKCIGLRDCDHEIMIAQTFCKESCDRIDHCFAQLELGKFENCDANYEEIAKKIFDNDGYVAQHPLTKNW